MIGGPSLRPPSSEPILGKAFGRHGQTQFSRGAGALGARLPFGLNEPRQGDGYQANTSLTFEEILQVCSFHFPSCFNPLNKLAQLLSHF